MPLRKSSGQAGHTLLETLLVVALIGILLAIAVPNLIAATRAAREGRAIAHIKMLSSTQNLYFGSNSKFGIIDALYKSNLLSDGQFTRHAPTGGGSGSPSNGASEVLSDGYYDYSFRYAADALSYTLDADPKTSLMNSYRFFRYRAIRNVTGGISGSSDIILVAPPQPSMTSPATTAYVPFNPH
jgi:prepilin-type N-terminal cleavage/methylation domain-containing protein